MKYGVNKATLVGNVGDEPKFNEKDGEIFLASFPLATSETYKDKKGDEVTNTQWHRVKDGNKHYSTEIECENFIYLRPKKAVEN
jgi:hypothetical protein